jgi:hypothetical protein
VVWGFESTSGGGNAVWGGWWRRQGWMTFLHLGVLAYLMGGINEDEKLQKLLMWIGTIVFVLGWVIQSGGLRFVGTLGEANSWGIISGVMGVLIWKSQKKLGGLISVLATVLSQSRAVILGVGWTLLGEVKNKFLVVSGVGVLLVVFGWATWWRGGGDRIVVWKETLVMWSQSPWWGLGFDNFQEKFSLHMENRGLEWNRYDQPHNLLLWGLIAVGSVGVAVFCGWWYLWTRGMNNKYLMRGVWAMIIYGLWQPWSISVWVLFVMLVGRLRPNLGVGKYQFSWLRAGTVIGLYIWWFKEMVWPTFSGYF